MMAMHCRTVALVCVVLGVWSCRSSAPVQGTASSVISFPVEDDSEGRTRSGEDVEKQSVDAREIEQDSFVIHRRPIEIYWSSECDKEEVREELSEYLKSFVTMLNRLSREHKMAFVGCDPWQWITDVGNKNVKFYHKDIASGGALHSMLQDLSKGGELENWLSTTTDSLKVMVTTASSTTPVNWKYNMEYMLRHFVPRKDFLYFGVYAEQRNPKQEQQEQEKGIHMSYDIMAEKLGGKLLQLDSLEEGYETLLAVIMNRSLANRFQASKDIGRIRSVSVSERPVPIQRVRFQNRQILLPQDALSAGETVTIVYEVGFMK